MTPGLNLECARGEGLPLEAALRRARELGYAFVEPYVYAAQSLRLNSHVSVQTASAYHHLDAQACDPQSLRRLLAELGLRLSALDAHSTLLLPQIAVPALRQVLDLAAELECPMVMSDEGPVALDWMDLDRAYDLMCFSLEAIIGHAQKRGVLFSLELHNALTTRLDCLEQLLRRFGSGELGVNFDTGNCFLAGNDPVAYLSRIAPRVVHVHVKDIPASQLPERGRVTGTRVGVAVGAGVVDLAGVVATLARTNFRGVLSVECETWPQAETSLPALRRLIQEAAG